MSKPTGRPRKYKSAEDMQIAIDTYFEKCEGETLLDEGGKPVLNKAGYPIRFDRRPPTVTGLALALGFNSRQALLNYQARSASFNDALTRAKSRCEDYAEARLYDKEGSNGAQFSLRNNFKGWSDKPEDKDTDEGVQIIDDL